ncbi:MAG: cell wall hydrolase [Lachnospiraceae bacterium]|nr:cell wall hydrolase [Lachnospiraceae bacterium]
MNANRALKKRLVSSTAVALSVVAMASSAYINTPVAEDAYFEPTGYATAGIVSELSDIQYDAKEQAELTVDEAAISVVAASLQEKKSKWDDRLMADVDDFVYVRKTADKDGEIVAKLRKGDVANVISEKGSWTKVRSGDVKGYVKSEYCVTGDEAKALYKSLDKDEMTTALSVEDEQALNQIYMLAKAEQAAEAAAQAQLQAEAAETQEAEAPVEQAEPVVTQNEAVEASVDDVTLLANLIYCEAGGEPYEGQVAVGAVVVNRLHAGYASSISGVIYQPYQFGPASSGKLASAIASGSATASCIQAAQEALAGASPVGDCKNFHRNRGDAGIVIGNHVFF